MIVAGRVFLRRERSSIQRLTSEHFEVVERDDRTRHDLRLAAAGDRIGDPRSVEETLERARAIAIVSNQRIVEIEMLQTLRRRRMPEGHQPIRFLSSQRLQQHRIHNTKDRGVRTDTQRERQHRNHRKRRLLQQPTHRKFHISDY